MANTWLITRMNSQEEADLACADLRAAYSQYAFTVKQAHWGSLSFYEIRIIFTDKISADRFVDMGMLIARGQRK